MGDFTPRLQKLLGERIKKRREELKLNQGELASKLQIGRTSVSNIEAGRQQPPLNVLYEICNALDIDIQSILPTYSELIAPSNPEQDEILDYLKNSDLDESLINQIKNLITKK